MANPPADETREQRYARQTAEQYEALGRFVQAFELMVAAIRMACGFMTSDNSVKRQQKMNLIFHHHTMSAWPLFEIYRALLLHILGDDEIGATDADRKVASMVLRQEASAVEDLIKKRNALLHGTWFIGWASNDVEDFSEMSVHKFRVKPQGLVPTDGLPSSAKELELLSSECKRLQNTLFMLQALTKSPDGVRIAANFYEVDGRWLPKFTWD